jgi:cell wall-associated NlpC family hydrolase
MKALHHSHPSGADYPSEMDMQCQIETNLPWGVTALTGRESEAITFWWGDQLPPEPLSRRQFRSGTQDCYTLVRDAIHVNTGRKPPDIPRGHLWWQTAGPTHLRDSLEKAGFTKTWEKGQPPYKPQFLDTFVARVGSRVENHLGVFTHDGMIMQHLSGRLSGTDPLSFMERFITAWYRFQ